MSNQKFSTDGYIDVAQRLVEFRTKHPDGRLRPVDPTEPFKVVAIGNKTFIAYAAAAYRDADDQLPGIGTAWEPFPGPTNFTRDSELQNAETSAWGRAIMAALAADSKSGIASKQEVEARQATQRQAEEPTTDVTTKIKKDLTDYEQGLLKAQWKTEGFRFSAVKVPRSQLATVEMLIDSFIGIEDQQVNMAELDAKDSSGDEPYQYEPDEF